MINFLNIEQYNQFNFKNKSYFVSPEWIKLSLTQGYKPYIVEMNNTVLPFVKKEKFLFHNLYLSSYNLYGDMIGNENENNIIDIIKQLRSNLFLYRMTFAPDPTEPDSILEKAFQKTSSFRTVSTHILKLENDYEYTLAKKINATRRNELRKAEKNPNIKILDMNITNLANWDQYHEIYQKSLLRWGKQSGYPKSLFYAMAQLNPLNVKLFGVQLNGRLVSGGIFFIYKNKILYWHGATLIEKDIAKYYPTSAMFNHIILFAHQNHLEYMNFGSSDGLDGVAKFKRSWGAGKVFYNIYGLK